MSINRSPPWAGQVWIRNDAAAPWLLDIVVTPDSHGRWVFRRDPTVVADLADVTWIADDGIIYQKPEVTLAFKARHARTKDDADLKAVLPMLAPSAKTWLADTIERLHPGHHWLAQIEASAGL